MNKKKEPSKICVTHGHYYTGHVTSLKQLAAVDKSTCGYTFAYLSMYTYVPFAFSYSRLSSNNNPESEQDVSFM